MSGALHQKHGPEEQRRAERQRLLKYCIDKKDLRHIEHALRTLQTFEGPITGAVRDATGATPNLNDLRTGLLVLLGRRRLHVSPECLIHGCICDGGAP